MDSKIIIREAEASQDVARFWDELHAYFRRDLFPDPADGEQDYFLGPEYRADMERLRTRRTDPLRFLFFQQDGQDVGFAAQVLYAAEDGKCFILEFCVLPEFRGQGLGRSCAAALLDWGRARGAAYFELNADAAPRMRFWRSLGFLPNGVDEWGAPLMLRPPEEALPFTVERLADPEDPALGWQLRKLVNSFQAEIGEPAPDDARWARLVRAVHARQIVFFLVKRGTRAIGMCSVAPAFSTFSCSEVGTFDDFFVEPVFRKQGAARLLAQTAQDWCKANGLASLTACCAPCDEGMYQSLGFTLPLGRTFAALP